MKKELKMEMKMETKETKERKAGMAGRLELVEGMRLSAIGARKRQMEFGLEDARMDFCDFFHWCAEWMHEAQMVVDFLEGLEAFTRWEGAEELADDLRGRIGMIELELVAPEAPQAAMVAPWAPIVEAPHAAPTELRGAAGAASVGAGAPVVGAASGAAGAARGPVAEALRAVQAGMVENGWRAIRGVLLVLADVLTRDNPELDEGEKWVLFRSSGGGVPLAVQWALAQGAPSAQVVEAPQAAPTELRGSAGAAPGSGSDEGRAWGSGDEGFGSGSGDEGACELDF